eukprot:TRINITY_DN3075_c0_g2_i1.p1 TRINITY_DN3075_c0_g2~~TRINITY_DN3075_c0_g2_i1.p1  ORF type:complete len:107 (-),score=4.07 TRINITY_DN3075_c0_g2_i1:51-371(-)
MAKMATIRSWFTTAYNESRVFYYHCHTGVDRTGEFSLAYSITYLNSTYEAELQYCDQLCNAVNGRDVMFLMRNAADWYCYYLYYSQGRKDLNCAVDSSMPVSRDSA